jgi:peptide/nickel transport system permease protein
MGAMTKLRRDPAALLGLLLTGLLFLAATLAPFLALHDPEPVSLGEKLLSPGKKYPLGTDSLGRCLYSRLLFGARITLRYSLTVLAITLTIGVPLGLLAGYYGGAVDNLIMRLVDIVLAFPNLVLVLVVIGVMGPGLLNAVLALALVSWVGYARMVRGVVLSIKETEYIAAARVCGSRGPVLLWRHIVPNILPPVAVLATLDLGKLILAIATLSFLGLGAQPPLPEWGAMINEARPFMQTAPRLMVLPGAAIALTVLGFNLLGDGLRDALDPQGYSGSTAVGVEPPPAAAVLKGGGSD